MVWLESSRLGRDPATACGHHRDRTKDAWFDSTELLGLQAAISAVHAKAEQTDWNQIVALYSVLQRIDSSPVVELNRAVAVAMRDGPEAGLVLIDAILKRGDLVDYHLAHAARAELCRRSGKMSDAKNSYERALSLARQEPERRFLTRRLSEI